MSVEVFTETTCDKCGRVVKWEGWDGSHVPPVGWGGVGVKIRAEGYAWGNLKQHNDLVLCPACVTDTLKFLGVPRKRNRKPKALPADASEHTQDVAQAVTGATPTPVLDAGPYWGNSGGTGEALQASATVSEVATGAPGAVFREVLECWNAVRPHRHKVADDEEGVETCLAPVSQYRVPSIVKRGGTT